MRFETLVSNFRHALENFARNAPDDDIGADAMWAREITPAYNALLSPSASISTLNDMFAANQLIAEERERGESALLAKLIAETAKYSRERCEGTAYQNAA